MKITKGRLEQIIKEEIQKFALLERPDTNVMQSVKELSSQMRHFKREYEELALDRDKENYENQLIASLEGIEPEIRVSFEQLINQWRHERAAGANPEEYEV